MGTRAGERCAEGIFAVLLAREQAHPRQPPWKGAPEAPVMARRVPPARAPSIRKDYRKAIKTVAKDIQTEGIRVERLSADAAMPSVMRRE